MTTLALALLACSLTSCASFLLGAALGARKHDH